MGGVVPVRMTMPRLHACSPAGTEVTSDGSESKPHVSYNHNCVWNDDTQAATATKLCQAAGFSGGGYVRASNSPCSSSYASGSFWYFAVDGGTVTGPKSGSPTNDAQITARCCSGQQLCQRAGTGSFASTAPCLVVEKHAQFAPAEVFGGVVAAGEYLAGRSPCVRASCRGRGA